MSNIINFHQDELATPSFDINAASALCEESSNPGLKPGIMLNLATSVCQKYRDASFDERVAILESEAKRYLDASKAETEVIHKTKEATHNIIDGVHWFTGYEAPEKPDYFPGA